MSTIRKQAIKLGIFVILVGATLLAALFVMGGLTFWKPAHRYHVVTSEAVTGIDINSDVTMRGVAVGKVRAIQLDHSDFSQVLIELDIDPDIKLPVGSKAYFQRIGLTGERVIDISGGTLADGELAPGSTIPREETELEGLEGRAIEIADELGTLVADLTTAADHLDALVVAIDPERIASIVGAVDPERIASIVEAVDPERIASIVGHAERSTKTIASAGAQFDRAIVEGRVDIAKLTQRIDQVAARATSVLEHANAILSANEADLRGTLHDLRQASKDAKALVEELRERPSLLLRPKAKEKKRKRRRR